VRSMIFLALIDCLAGAFGGEGGFSCFKSRTLSSLARLYSDSFKNSSFYASVKFVCAVFGGSYPNLAYVDIKLSRAEIPKLWNLLASLSISFF